MRTTQLHPTFGLEIHDVQLKDITASCGYPELRELFESHSLLLFRKQNLTDAEHLRLGQLFGPIEDRSKGANGPDPIVSPVSNVDDQDQVIDEHDIHVQHLKANQLWHTDSTFLPVPALANILVARVTSEHEGETELVSTRVAWRDMPDELKVRARGKVFCHRYAHSRKQISSELARETLITMWDDQAWRAVWPNPVNGEEALYIASHVFAVRGMNDETARTLVGELIEFATQEQYVYSHHWETDDVLMWDERATMHRGRPWPYDQPRVLSSICISAQSVDGLDTVRA